MVETEVLCKGQCAGGFVEALEGCGDYKIAGEVFKFLCDERSFESNLEINRRFRHVDEV